MSDDDELLRRIGEAMRPPDALDDERWDRLAAGALSEEEVEALRALAEADGRPEAAEAFAPLGDDFEARMAGLFAAAEAPRSNVVPLRPSRWKYVAGAVVGLAAAAAALLLVLLRPAPTVTLPAYEMSVQGGDQPMRSTEAPAAAVPVLAADSLLSITLRPAHRSEITPRVQVWVRGPGGARRAVEAPVEVHRSGAVTLEAPLRALVGTTPGEYELVVLVSAPGERVDPPDRLEPTPGRQVFRQRVKLLAE